ncbi:MAG: neutral zinc metallopeptidase [Bowdeniella nasicola]|nr:neutral zinc metallopeptidase [Bowdeniella nasicola]
MTFNDGIRTNPARARSSRGRTGAMVGGIGGVGGIVVLLLYMAIGGNPLDLIAPTSSQSGPAVAESHGVDLSHCTDGRAANTYAECRMIATAESLDEVWKQQLPAQADIDYEPANLHLFTQAVSTGCGDATSATGPFFCSRDDTVYLDVSFFTLMESQLGATNAPLSQEYLLAHEWGHHIQHITGQLRAVDHRDIGPDSQMVRMETQADCYAGIWVHYASHSIDPESGEAFVKPITQAQIHDVINATQSVGDDHIQSQHGHVQPDQWTHGSSDMRTHWFMTGYESGEMGACNTWTRDFTHHIQ